MSVTVTPAEVKKLRDKTGAGMLDCKKALVEAAGDFAEAEKALKKKGLASAEKRSDRVTSQGSVFIKERDAALALCELTCETDFVAKTDQFQELGGKLLDMVLDSRLETVSSEMETLVKETVVVLKENMTIGKIRYIESVPGELFSHYSHDGGKIGVVVKLRSSEAGVASNDTVTELAHDLALHAAAYNPLYLDRSQVDDAFLKEQEEIFTDQVQKQGIPEKAREGAIKGKINKLLSGCCFVDQGFVKEDKKSVAAILKEKGSEVGSTLEIADFLVVKVGADS